MTTSMPNLPELIERLPEGSLAREMASVIEAAPSLDVARETLRALVTERIDEKTRELTHAQAQID